MIWDQGPRITLGLGLFQDSGQAIEEGLSVLVISEKLPPFNSPGHYMLEEAGGIKSGLAGHEVSEEYTGSQKSLFAIRALRI